ncbi:hypothetical protein [Actinomadura latina]|uniref:Uncharacterized protein n=1 Tax=Actinomadura latina TaxID=163603 RepID=A0A846YY80_9ACTN|nr:hypothetical protein [Actinomadura latina]NKZ03116.1 hypothetical protein [Actinomadura latina]
MTSDDDATVPARARVPRVLRWWPPLFALWMLFVGEWSWLIGVWGAVMALIGAVSAGLVVSAGLLDARGRWRWCRELGPAAVAAIVDFAIVVHVLATSIAAGRREAGVFLEDASEAGRGSLPAGRRAWVEMVAGWPPNCYVLDISPDTGRRLIHDLRPHRASERPS